MINFVKTNNFKICEDKLYQTLSQHLQNKEHVLLIIAGGSNIPIIKNVFDRLENKLTINLDLILSDERFGPSNFKDSNFNKFIQAGFNQKQASFENILIDKDIETSRAILEKQFTTKLAKADFVLAQLGIGEDGHIAGILPNSSAIKSDNYVASFKGIDFERITLTFKALKMIDEAFLAVFGKSKKRALKHLKNLDQPIENLPSKILQEIKSIYLYNNQIE